MYSRLSYFLLLFFCFFLTILLFVNTILQYRIVTFTKSIIWCVRPIFWHPKGALSWFGIQKVHIFLLHQKGALGWFGIQCQLGVCDIESLFLSFWIYNETRFACKLWRIIHWIHNTYSRSNTSCYAHPRYWNSNLWYLQLQVFPMGHPVGFKGQFLLSLINW